MYALAQKNGHVIWKEWWYTIMLKVSLQANLYMTQENQVCIANVVVIDLTQETMASNVINQLTSVIAELSTIAKIRKYRKLHEGHHFILMAMEVHDTPGCDMDRFIRECAYLFHDRQLKGHLSLYFYIHFFR
jgi:hypothetical protein